MGFETANGERGTKLGQRNVQRLEVFKEAAAEMTEESIEAIEGDDSQSLPETSTHSEPKPKVRHRRKSLTVDADLLRTVADSFSNHERHKIGSRHNRRHPDIEKIAQVVSLNS